MDKKIVLYFRAIIIIAMVFALTISCINIYNMANQFLNTEQITFVILVYFVLAIMLFITLFEIFKLKKIEDNEIDIIENYKYQENITFFINE